jgi:hypothetical protein
MTSRIASPTRSASLLACALGFLVPGAGCSAGGEFAAGLPPDADVGSDGGGALDAPSVPPLPGIPGRDAGPSEDDAMPPARDASAPPVDAAPPPPVDAGPPPDPCTLATPSADGVFAAPGGSTAPSCGSMGAPCASLQTAIDGAAAAGKSVVYLAAGTYEQPTLRLRAGVALEGGWLVGAGGKWSRQCTGDQSAIAILRAQAPADTTIVADVAGLATLRFLTVASKASALPGQTLYGVVARGASTHLALEAVEIAVAAGGAGGDGAPGRAAVAGADGCTSPANPTVVPAPGVPGAGALSGTFSASGYTSPPAQPGTDGATGPNGWADAAGQHTCVTGSPCASDAIARSCKQPQPTVTDCGTDGTVGCGGGSGGGGTPGGNGGSSIALFISEAVVTASAGRFVAGSGGSGGAGGAGTPGGPAGHGTYGVKGTITVYDACRAAAPASKLYYCEGTTAGAVGWGGYAGSDGGGGSAGGAGGGGSGGASYAYVRAPGAATLTLSGTSLVHGAGGAAGKAPKPGAAGVGADHN